MKLEIVFILAALLDPRPAACEVNRFPPEWMIDDALTLNAEHKDWLYSEKIFHVQDWEGWEEVYTETGEIQRAWHLLRLARSDHWSENCRRGFLEQLRELIGPEAFYAGQMPPPIPYWRYSWGDQP